MSEFKERATTRRDTVEVLREVASAATPGAWDVFYGPSASGLLPDVVTLSLDRIATVIGHDGMAPLQCRANAAFIAAANPRTILALCDEIERLRKIVYQET